LSPLLRDPALAADSVATIAAAPMAGAKERLNVLANLMSNPRFVISPGYASAPVRHEAREDEAIQQRKSSRFLPRARKGAGESRWRHR
jgi:hypothetical protein